MVNECFGVGVVSEAKDGVAPELNPGWVHRRINTHPEVRYRQLELKICSEIKTSPERARRQGILIKIEIILG